MSRSAKKTPEEKTDTSGWMMTFSDLVMLLLTFFVLLLTMSSMDNKRLKDLFTNFSGATGVLEFAGMARIKDLASLVRKYHSSDGLLVISQNTFEDMVLPEMDADDIKKQLKDSGQVHISDDSRGLVLSFQEKILFDPGQAVLSPAIFPILNNIATAIETTPNDILIMGHTDDVPIGGELFASNWELATYRGLSVLNYFLEHRGLEPRRFYVGGYGPSRPLVDNDTPANRAKNRRVEIIFKHL